MKKAQRALKWIVEILRESKVKFQISGGLAAKAYGSKRKLADIDIDISEKDFKKIKPKVKDYIKFGPKRYKSKNWDIYLLTIEFKGQKIDIGGAYKTKIYNPRTKKWVRTQLKIYGSKQKKILGIKVPVMSKKELIEYKKILNRKVDREDIKAMRL